MQTFASTEKKQKSQIKYSKTSAWHIDSCWDNQDSKGHKSEQRGTSELGGKVGHGPILGAGPGLRMGAAGPGRQSLPADRDTSGAHGTTNSKIRDLNGQVPGEKGKQRTNRDTASFSLILAEFRSHVGQKTEESRQKDQKSWRDFFFFFGHLFGSWGN